MPSLVDLVHRSLRVGAVRPGRGDAVSIDLNAIVGGRDHVVTFVRDADGRKRGTWATSEPAQFVTSGYYRLIASLVHALGSETVHDALQDALRPLHGYVCAVADAALVEYDAARGARA